MSVSTPLLSDAPIDGWGSPSPEKSLPRSKDRTLPFVLLACAVSLLSLFFNLAFTLRSSPSSPPPPPHAQAELRYADPYIGLSSAVLKHPYHPAPITNFPGLLARVNASAPGEVYLETPSWASNFGTIYSEDRTFVVQSGVSTIFQFRTIDFGMETCVLTLATNASASVSPRPFTLAVWTLTTPAPLSPHTLSWDTRPSRRELLATLPFTFTPGASTNELRTPEFACPARTLLTFEVACAEGGKEDACYMKFVQDNKSRELGLFLTQYAASPSEGDGEGENDENDADA
ncbi:hypothetical protein C8R44DRAFT_809765 [Mycena epipterygia]|nr:hypothetical protein C8R44DRAFT_809765 [Mycena epipterygia]